MNHTLPRSRVTRREWIIATFVALILVALMLIPYWLGYTLARPDTEFTGVLMNPEDSQSYFAKMLQGYDGNWLYTIPYTTEEHAPAFVGGFYLLLGRLARVLSMPIIAMWHTARVIADLILFLTVFGFIATFIAENRARWTAYLLALFGSGLGWVLFLLNQTNWLGAFPVDFKMPESHLFFTALTFPHVALGTTLIIVNVRCVLGLLHASSNRARWAFAFGAGAVNVTLAIAYPFLIYLVLLIDGLYFLFLIFQTRRFLWHGAIALTFAFLIPAPLVLYYAATLSANPIYRAWDAQSITLSPPLPHYLVAYGLMLSLAFLARKRSEHAILWVWLIAAALLVYAPLNPQRRFVQGIQVPLSILATAGLFDYILPRFAQTRLVRSIIRHPRYSIAGLERLLIAAFLGFMSLSNLYILASVSATTALQQPYPLFRSRDEIAAVDWLRINTQRSDVVMSAYETGNYIAAHAGNRVVIGHWAETVDWESKFDEMEYFFGSMDDTQRIALLNKYSVAYVFYGARERQVGDFDPSRVRYLSPVFSNATIQVYRVVR